MILAGYDGAKRVQGKADDIKKRFGVDVRAVDGSTEEKKIEALQGVEVVFCAAAAGVQVLSSASLASAKSLLVAADVNAVPPAGIEGLELFANGAELAGGVLGVGPLAIGDVKYKTEAGLFQRMATSTKALSLDFATPSSWRVRSPEAGAAILIAASSGRALAAAARRSGYRPLVADLFDDEDTRALAATNRLAGHPQSGFDGEALIAALDAMAELEAPAGLVYGAGFEDRIDSSKASPALDCFRQPTGHGAVREKPGRIGAPLRRFPAFRIQTSASRCRKALKNWLVKSIGGAGGSHVAPAAAWQAGCESVYFQRIAPGDPISLLLLAYGTNADVLGASRQWPAPAPDEPFRFGGSLRPARLSPKMEVLLAKAAKAVAGAAGLRGLKQHRFSGRWRRFHPDRNQPSTGRDARHFRGSRRPPISSPS